MKALYAIACLEVCIAIPIQQFGQCFLYRLRIPVSPFPSIGNDRYV
jgi:hypothetical protein